MSEHLTIFINNQPVYEHERTLQLDDDKLAFLDKMDSDMQRGIRIRGELITEPDADQRAQFVAMNLLKALKQENHAIISASLAYLLSRCPGLIEIHANDREGYVEIELVTE